MEMENSGFHVADITHNQDRLLTLLGSIMPAQKFYQVLQRWLYTKATTPSPVTGAKHTR